MSVSQVLGQYYINRPIVIGERYKQVLTNISVPMSFSLPPDTISQQDGALQY